MRAEGKGARGWAGGEDEGDLEILDKYFQYFY